MKYIDADELKNKVNELRQDWLGSSTGLEVAEEGAELGAAESILDSIDDIIDSLQQGQPDVELDKEIIRYKVPFSDDKEYLNETTLDSIARHFAEWGAIHLNARKEGQK